MRQLIAGLLCVAMIAGCNAAGTTSGARTVCDSVGASTEVINNLFEIAQDDRDAGVSADESKELFDGDCAEMCGNDNECRSECETCTHAVVDEVYAN